jgi:uncharacterized membrane protein HdeD (DUF308 family)
MVEKKQTLVQKANPLRSDVSWQWNLIQGLVALGVGLYTLLAEDSAWRNIVFVIGLFLLVNGVIYALEGIRSRNAEDPLLRFRLIRAGMGIATGLAVVIDRFTDFLSLDAARVIAGIGLVGMGLVTLAGLIMVRENAGVRIGTVLSAVLLAVWGGIILYQSTTDDSMTRWLGWIAIVAGVAILGLAWYRRQSSMPLPTGAARA